MASTGFAQVAPSRPVSADGKVPSASAIYRNTSAQEAFPALEVSTLYELFINSVNKYPNNECLGKREKKEDGTVGPFVFKTYKQVGEDVAALASGLRAIGVNPKQRVGVLGPNCPEWMITMQACNRMSMHCVPLYDSLGENAIEFIINHAECVVAFVDTAKFPAVVKALELTKGVLKAVVYWGAGNAAAQQTIKDQGYEVYSFEELKALGAGKPAEPVPPAPEDMCTIMYTSGTTGDPKGVMLKHSAVLAAVSSCHNYCKLNGVDFKPPDRLLSYLPLAHIFDRVNEEWFLYMGCTIGYWQGDVTKLVEDISVLKPALFIGVPRVFDRIYTGITTQIKGSGFIKRFLFNMGYGRKLHNIKQGRSQAHAAPFFDRLIFSKIAARLGGNVKAVVSGGAPLASHVEEFLRVTMCAPVVQGYGLTESCAASFIASADNIAHQATVGPPTPCTEVRLESVPDMNYDALDAEPKGEVLIRGPQLFTGYYKQQDKTDEVLESDGWFHTGDIGVILKDGTLKIIDRKKNMFKLSQGEYVAVEKLENTYKKCPLVDQCWVYGNSFESTLVAVVVPGAALKAWASTQGISGELPELITKPEVKKYVLAELNAVGKADKLKGFELLKDVLLESTPFSIEEDLLTPTFKFKRPQLQKKYQAQIDAMYQNINATTKA